MSVTIKAGGFYVTRSGVKVGPVKLGPNRHKWPGDFWMITDTWGLTWWSDGRVHKDRETEMDIVSEWVDLEALPVRQVTRHEIVPGTYGRVEVGSPAGRHGVTIVTTWAAAVWNAAELRAAARVFISLAEALEQEP